MNDQWSILLELDLLQIEWLKHLKEILTNDGRGVTTPTFFMPPLKQWSPQKHPILYTSTFLLVGFVICPWFAYHNPYPD